LIIQFRTVKVRQDGFLELGSSSSASHSLVTVGATEFLFPAVIVDAGEQTARRFAEFFAAQIENDNTRCAYARAVSQFFSWCETRNLGLQDIDPIAVAGYFKGHSGSAPTKKQHLAALRMLFDWLVTGGVMRFNPAASVKGPKHVIKRGKTPVLQPEDARALFDAIDVSTLRGLRDRAFLGIMVFSFARVSAVVSMRVGDYYQNGKRCWLRLHEKGGRYHEVPAHHLVEEYVDAYLAAAGIGEEKATPLFRSAPRRSGQITERAINRRDALRMVKKWSVAAGVSSTTCNHSFRATGITVFRKNGGTLEQAQQIAAHASPKTTMLYDRSGDEISLSEIERVHF
jgi:integrase/recombinase XerD